MALETGCPKSELIAPYDLRVINYRIPEGGIQHNSGGKLDDYLLMTDEERMTMLTNMAINLQSSCDYMMRDKDFMSRLDRLDFDIIIVDGFTFDHCRFIVPHYLRVPFVDFFSWSKQWDARIPVFPSVVPHTWMDFGEQMTFRERLSNFIHHVSMEWADHLLMPANTSLLRQYAPEFRSWSELRRKAALFISTTDYILGIRHPSLPNTLHVPPFSVQPAQPLPAHIERIVSRATDHGVIVMSLGSLLHSMPSTLFNKFIGAFSQLPQTVLLRYKTSENGTIPDVPNNVHLLSWLPQNDIIGHARTVLFVTHGGNGGIHEAVYHGVPMVALPIFAEQSANTVRMVRSGFGLSLDFNQFTASELVSVINEVLHNASYRTTTGKASAIMKDRPMTGLETATFWVEHVMKFGGAHLRSHGQDMAAYEFFMLDIMAFLLVLLVVAILVLWTTARFVFGLIIGGIRRKEKSQ